MFKTLAGSSILAVAQAIAFNGQATTLAQESIPAGPLTSTSAGHDNSCCCSTMPCMPTCGSPCGGPGPKKVEPSPPTPQPIRNIELNLPIILTHILHQVNPPQIPATPDGEQNLIENVITPIVIQLMNDDIVPAIPTCTWPEGTTAGDWGINSDGTLGEQSGPKKVMPDTDEVLTEVLQNVLEGLNLPDSVDQDQLIADSLPSDDVIADIDLTSEDGLKQVDIIVTGMEKTVSQVLDGEVVTDATIIPESVAKLADELDMEILNQDE